jgi:pimeloyl-ACP methyl ester carboxylesterase
MSRRIPTRPLLIGILSTLVGTFGGALSLAYYVVNLLTRPAKPGETVTYFYTPFEFGVTFEVVEFPAAGGEHAVQGWFLPHEGTRRVIVLCPGYRQHKSDLLGMAIYFWRSGYQVLLFDFYGHGHAWGKPVTLGHREVKDFLGAMDYVEQRVPGAIIGVIGYSMGAAVSIMGAARCPQVRALVADSPFARHWDVVGYNFTRVVRLPARPFLFLADHLMRLRAGYRFRDVEPLREVARIAPRPLLLIHGLKDMTIAPLESQRLYAAAGEPKELWLVEGAGHCGAYFEDRAYYCQRIGAFFETHLRERNEETPGAFPVLPLEERAAS